MAVHSPGVLVPPDLVAHNNGRSGFIGKIRPKAPERKFMVEAGKTFGSCCEELKEALEGGDFEPCITVGSDEVFS